MPWVLANWKHVAGLGMALAVLALVGWLYAWGKGQEAARVTAEAGLAEARTELATARASIQELVSERQAIDQAMAERDREKEQTQERLRSASAELSRLRRDNAELRAWLDRPIPDDVVRLLMDATGSGGRGRAAAASEQPAR